MVMENGNCILRANQMVEVEKEGSEKRKMTGTHPTTACPTEKAG